VSNATRSDVNESHFETRHLLPDLKNRAVASTVVPMASQAVRFALIILSVIVLTRLVVRRDFGLVAIATDGISPGF
jgi:hypothetical protein